MVRPSGLKLARSGMVVFTVTSAVPLLSEKAAEGIALLANVNVGDAGAIRGSRLKVILNLPGSVAIEGFTGAVNWSTRRDASSAATAAVKWVPTLPMKRRLDSGCKVAEPPRNRGRRELRAGKGTSPRPF